MIVKQCLNCGNDFKTYLSRVKIGSGKFCIDACYHEYAKGKKSNLSEEGREKMRLASTGNHYALGYKHTPEEIEKIREAGRRRVGMEFTEEHKENISKARLGVKRDIDKMNKFPEYRTLHLWLESNYGKADRCENFDCVYPRENARGKLMIKPRGFDWAKIRSKQYERKRENFVRLCKSCHMTYDRRGINIKLIDNTII